MPPKRQTRLQTGIRNARNLRIIQELYDAIDILTERINRWDIFIQNHRDAVNLQLGIDSRNDLQQRLNTVMVRLMGYL